MKAIITALFVVFAFSSLGRAENAISDGGFEGGLGRWQNRGSTSSGSLSSERSRSGSSSAKIHHPNSTTSGWLRMTTDLESGFLYSVTAYVYRSTNTISAHFSMHTDTPPFSRSANSGKSQRIGEWEQLGAELITRRNGTIWIQLSAEGVGSIWFDDVSVNVLKTRAERKEELLAVVNSQKTSNSERARANMELGEIEYIDKAPALAAAYYAAAIELSPDDEALCREALDAVAKASRRARDFANASAALRKLVEKYSLTDAEDNARNLTSLGWALGEEADHAVPDYAAALAILDEALRVFSEAAEIYRAIDSVAHKRQIDTLEDRLTVTRYDIKQFKELGRSD